MAIPYGQVITCAAEAGDTDIFRFAGVAGERIVIQATRGGGINFEPCILLAGPTGTTQTACVMDIINGLDVTLTATGPYSILISDHPAASGAGPYTLALERLTPPSPTAVLIQYGASQPGAIDPGGDLDLFHFQGTAGDRVSILVSRISGINFDPCITLAGPAGTTQRACSLNVFNSLDVTLVTTGTYAILVNDHPGAVGVGPYTLSIQCLSGPCPAGPPTTVNDAYATGFNAPLNVAAPGVLANDGTNRGGTMTALLATNVANGALALAANGGFTYTPTAGFSGTDTFTYLAANAVGNGNVATVTLTVATGPPTAQPPTGLYASANLGNTVTLRWTPPAFGLTPTGYVVEGGINPGQVLGSVATGSTAATFTLVAPTGAFYVRVHTLAGAAKSVASNEIRLFVNVAAAPSAPVNLLGLVNGANLSLAWRNTFGGGTPTALLLDVSGTLSGTVPLPLADSFGFAGVPGGTYTLGLRATNAAGVSGPSNTVTLTVPGACSGAPLIPANFVASQSGSVVTASWDPAATGPAPTGFVLTVTGSFAGAFPTTLRSLSGAVAPGTYTLSVYATNACGNSASTSGRTVVIG